MRTGLEAVREHSMQLARSRAETILREARAEAQAILDAGNAESASLREAAEREGARAAELDGGREWTGARRRARSLVLQAKRAAYEELCREIARAVRSDGRLTSLLDAIADGARRQLGPGTEVEVIAGGAGEVVATRRDQRIRWSVEQVAEQSLDSLGGRIEELWR